MTRLPAAQDGYGRDEFAGRVFGSALARQGGQMGPMAGAGVKVSISGLVAGLDRYD